MVRDIRIINRVAAKFAAKVKHPEVVKSMVDFFKNGAYKSYLKLKSARAGKIVLDVEGLNKLADRIEITDLNGDRAKFVIYLKNGDSGWGWDEWRLPPKFHNDAKYNEIKLDLLASDVSDPKAFTDRMESICHNTLVPVAQKAGWVRDPNTSKVPMPLAEWQKANSPEQIKKTIEDSKGTREDMEALVRKALKVVQSPWDATLNVNESEPKGAVVTSVFTVHIKQPPARGISFSETVYLSPSFQFQVSYYFKDKVFSLQSAMRYLGDFKPVHPVRSGLKPDAVVKQIEGVLKENAFALMAY